MTTLAQHLIDQYSNYDRSYSVEGYSNDMSQLFWDCMEHLKSKTVHCFNLTFCPFDTLNALFDTTNMTPERSRPYVRLTTNPIWIEFPYSEDEYNPNVKRMGFYVRTLPGSTPPKYGCCWFVVFEPYQIKLNATFLISHLPYEGDENAIYTKVEKDSEIEFGRHGFMFIRYSLAMLNLPRLTTYKKNEETPLKKQKARAKAGKPAIIEYTNVVLNVGKEQMKLLTERSQPGQKRKFHHVIGHFRTYTYNRPEPHTIWINEHFRGDMNIGQTISSHEVKL